MADSPRLERCHGVDVLKTISMLMVLILHILGWGGIMAAFPDNCSSGTFWTAWILEIGAYCCVNCFAIATGYLMVGRKIRYRKLIPMWLTVVFYCGIGFLWKKYGLHEPIYLITLLETVFPVSASVYWYFTAYVCLYLFLPFLNLLVENMSRRQHGQLLVIGFLLSCVPQVANITRLWSTDILGLNDGYGAFWLMYLYLLGAGMKKYGFFCRMSSGKAMLGYAAMVLLTCLSKYGYGLLPEELPGIVVSIVREYGSGRFISYISPTIVAEAVFLSAACINWKVPLWMQRPLAWLSPLIFQVYIIHISKIPYSYLENRFAFLAAHSPQVLVVCVLGIAAGIFSACIVIDTVRFKLFQVLRVEQRANCLADWIVKRANALLGNEQEQAL